MPPPSWLASQDPDLNHPLAKFIQDKEGWTPGSVSQKNNNPGNLKYVKQPGATGADEHGFARFPDYQTGLAALNKQIELDSSRGLTFRQFTAKYAPKDDHNDPEAYAKSLAASTGHNPDDPISVVGGSTRGKPSWLKGATGAPGHSQAANGTPIVPPVASFEYVGNLLHRGMDGALRGVGLPDTSDPAWKNPIRASDIPAALNPWNLIKGVSDTQVGEVQKGADAMNKLATTQGIMNKVGAGVSAVGHGIATILPPLAPLADAQDRTTRGDVAGGLTQGITSLVAPELMNKGLDAAVGRISGNTPIPSNPVTGEYPAAPAPPTPAEVNFQRSAKKVIEATNPGDQTPKLKDALRTVFPEYQAVEPLTGPITAVNRKIAGQMVESKYNQNFHNYFDPAVDRGQEFDGKVIRDEKMDAIPASLRPDPLDDPNNPAIQTKQKQYQRLTDDANSWDRKFDAKSLYDRLQENNAESQKFYDMTPDQQYAAEIAGRPVAQVKAEGVGLRKALYQGIDPASGGKNIAENQGRYSDAITFRQHMDRMDNTVEQQNTPSTLQNLATAGSDALGLLSGRGADIVKRRAMEPDTLHDKIASAFKNYKGDPLPKIPDPPPLITPKSVPPEGGFTLQAPSGNSRFTVQRALFGDKMPSYQEGSEVGSKPDLELTRPPAAPFEQQRQLNLNGPFPWDVSAPQVRMTPTDPKTFDWQRALFPQMPERPVSPPPVNP